MHANDLWSTIDDGHVVLPVVIAISVILYIIAEWC